VTIDDLTIANGLAGSLASGYSGGAIQDIGPSSLSLSRVTFANNQAELYGGAIYAVNGSIYNLNVSDCSFTGNRVVGLTGFQNAVGGAAIVCDYDNLTVISTSFTNNTVLGVNGGTGSTGASLDMAVGGARRVRATAAPEAREPSPSATAREAPSKPRAARSRSIKPRSAAISRKGAAALTRPAPAASASAAAARCT
jgi:predicted outer membrane repeat protein